MRKLGQGRNGHGETRVQAVLPSAALPDPGFRILRMENGGPARKQPYFISSWDGMPFSFAGLWETWITDTGEAKESCAMLDEAISRVYDYLEAAIDQANPP